MSDLWNGRREYALQRLDEVGPSEDCRMDMDAREVLLLIEGFDRATAAESMLPRVQELLRNAEANRDRALEERGAALTRAAAAEAEVERLRRDNGYHQDTMRLFNEALSAERAQRERADEALRLVLMFYEAGHWDDMKRALWKAATGSSEATTRVLCDFVRAALAREGSSDG